MTKLIINLDENTVEKAKRVAQMRHTNLDEMVRDFIEQIAVQVPNGDNDAVAELDRSFRDLSRPMGGVDWAGREELYE